MTQKPRNILKYLLVLLFMLCMLYSPKFTLLKFCFQETIKIGIRGLNVHLEVRVLFLKLIHSISNYGTVWCAVILWLYLSENIRKFRRVLSYVVVKALTPGIVVVIVECCSFYTGGIRKLLPNAHAALTFALFDVVKHLFVVDKWLIVLRIQEVDHCFGEILFKFYIFLSLHNSNGVWRSITRILILVLMYSWLGW